MLTTDPPNSQTFLRNCYLYHTLADKDQIRYKNLRIPIHQWPPLWQFNQVGCLTGGIYLSYQRVRVRRSEHNWTASQPVTGLVETNHCQTRWTSRKMVFCYQNCSNLLWEKNVLVIEKNFWNSRLKAENFQNFRDHLNNLFKQWKVRTISGNRMLF